MLRKDVVSTAVHQLSARKPSVGENASVDMSGVQTTTNRGDEDDDCVTMAASFDRRGILGRTRRPLSKTFYKDRLQLLA